MEVLRTTRRAVGCSLLGALLAGGCGSERSADAACVEYAEVSRILDEAEARNSDEQVLEDVQASLRSAAQVAPDAIRDDAEGFADAIGDLETPEAAEALDSAEAEQLARHQDRVSEWTMRNCGFDVEIFVHDL